jgi:hypothetical protein
VLASVQNSQEFSQSSCVGDQIFWLSDFPCSLTVPPVSSVAEMVAAARGVLHLPSFHDQFGGEFFASEIIAMGLPRTWTPPA